MDLGLRSAVGNQAGPGIRQLRSDLGCHYHMGCSIETSLKSLLFLVLFPEGVSGDGSLSFAHVTTKLAVSPGKQKSRALLSRYSYLLLCFLKLLSVILDSTRQVTSATSTILSYLFGCVVLRYLSYSKSEELSLIHWWFFLLTNPRQLKELLILLWFVDEHCGVETRLYLFLIQQVHRRSYPSAYWYSENSKC